MSSFTGIRELRESYRKLGATKFWLLLVATFAFIAIGAWLMITTRWPGNCDHRGRGITGIAKQFYCSPNLLSGDLKADALFVWLWSIPTIAVGAIVYGRVYARRHRP